MRKKEDQAGKVDFLSNAKRVLMETPIYVIAVVYFVLASIFVPYFFNNFGNVFRI